jgi:hypothetical protein
MNVPANPPRPVTFVSVIQEISTACAIQRRTSTYALEIGIRPDELIRYAKGDRPEGFHELLVRSSWAMDRVSALVRSLRDPDSIGCIILKLQDLDPYMWGIYNTGDWDADLATLIDQVE